MGREAGRMITFNDAQYMVDNEGFTAKDVIPVSNSMMTKADIQNFLEVDGSFITSYGSTQLVPYDKIVAVATDTTAPSVPTKFQYNNDNYDVDGDGSFDDVLVWTASTDNEAIDKYEIQRKINSGSYSFLQFTTGTAIAIDLSGLDAGETFCYRIRAIDTSGNTSAWASEVCINGVAPSELTLSQYTLTIPGNGGIFTIQLYSNTSWSVSRDAGLTVSPLSGTNNSSINVSAQANNSGSSITRRATFSTNDGNVTRRLTVTQEADDFGGGPGGF